MDKNLDIDRISLEDRIKRLEGRFPSGGGGGNFPFAIPSGQDFENAKVNAATDIGTGIIFKVEIPNTSTFPGIHSNFPTNFEFRMCTFYPRVNGFIFQPSMMILKTSKLQARPETGGATLGAFVDFDWTDFDRAVSWNRNPPSASTQSFFATGNNYLWYPTSWNPLQFTFAGTEVSYEPLRSDLSKLTLRFSSVGNVASAISWTAYGCIFYPFPNSLLGGIIQYQPIHPIGGLPRSPYGQTLQDYRQLDAELKPIYPSSWYA